MKYTILASLSLTLMTACGSIQTTSGADYVSARPGYIDKEIKTIAAVEPQLKFPAKIGLARIINGQLTAPSEHELEKFGELAQRKRNVGEFVAISPFSAELAASRLPSNQQKSGSVLQTVRRAAAVQHVDYVLVYEIGAQSGVYNTPFALADATIIGGVLLPTRGITVSGTGTAVFLDVRNGYPYATIQTNVDLSGLARSFGASRIESKRLQGKAIEKVAVKLVPEFEKSLDELVARQ